MRIALVGPGFMPIPPIGWGAVEILIWDYYQTLIKYGHNVLIINTQNPNEIINQINEFGPDIVHIQYDDYYFISNNIEYKTILTSHYAYLDQPEKHGNYKKIFDGFVKSRSHIFALSDSIKNTYISNGRDPETITVIPNGVRTDLFKFIDNPEDKSIYLAKIDFRKRQYLYQSISNLYFAGNISDNRFNPGIRYLGEWNKEYLYNNLTNYSNLVLLSDGEAHPLVCLEAMSAGLGLVVSEYATANLDISKDWIDVIPESRINDIEYISNTIEENRKKSRNLRKDIREYVIYNFDYRITMKNYIKNIEELCKI